MRNVDSRLLMEKMDEVRQCITTHQSNETVHVDSSLSLNVDAGRVTIMHGQGFASQLTRQVSVGDHVGDEPWSEELLDAADARLDALVAHLTQHSRAAHHVHHKVSAVRGDVDTSVILDPPLRTLFNGQTLEGDASLVVQVPSLPPLPPLQEMKRCPETDWFNKTKTSSERLVAGDSELELGVVSPAPGKPSKKSLPHKKRISRKLKRSNGNTTPHQDIVVISCSEEGQQEEILPDNFVAGVPHANHIQEETHHIAHEVRPLFICTVCGEFYGEDQIKFYHHLKQHYEPPPPPIIIENDLAMDKVTNTCIVDNVATLPDSIVELSLENTVPKTMYQQTDKHIMYTTSDKAFYPCKLQYSMASIDKEPQPPPEPAKAELYEPLDKMEFTCAKCYKTFRKQKHCEEHIKQAHSNPKVEDMGEFSEPEDLMEGIHVSVEEGEQYAHMLPHLTVDNGHVHQEHAKHWYGLRSDAPLDSCGDGGYCAVCPDTHAAQNTHNAQSAQSAQGEHNTHTHDAHNTHNSAHVDTAHHAQHESAHHLKEEVLQRMFEGEMSPAEQNYCEPAADNEAADTQLAQDKPPPANDDKKKSKQFSCPQCPRVFQHRNSLLYHALSHAAKQQTCRECGKGFYTPAALKIHKRVHNGDRPYKCEECGREFRQWSDLKYHRVSLHSDQKHYKCEFCGKEFARKYSLNVHRRIHTGEKNYKCDYCTKTFRASSYRLSHMRTHTGHRPYKCSQCDKCFRVSGDLQRHTLVHDKNKLRFEDKKPKEDKPKRTQKKEIKNEPTVQQESPKKKPAQASTTRQPTVLKNDKKQKKKPVKKDGAPNVTVTNNKEFKINNEYADEVFEPREYKFKEVYDNEVITYKVKDYDQIINYKEEQRMMDKELAILKPMYSKVVTNVDRPYEYRTENTDGKMQIFTHVEKKDYAGSIVTNVISDRNLDRDRELHGETIENGFLDKLTAFYNISAV